MPIIDARYYKTVVICPNRGMAAELAPMLSHGLPLAPVTPVQSYPNRRQLLDLVKTIDPKIFFLDFSDGDRAFNVLSDIQQVAATTPVIALLPGSNADLMLKCVRQGATDLLIRPFTADQMDAAVEKIARTNPPPAPLKAGRGGKIIAVFPSKGACGASTVASSLAFQARRAGQKKVLLADLDPLTGTISFLLKLKHSYSFLDVLTRQETLDAELWKQMVTPSHNVDVLLAPDHLVEGLDQLRDPSPIIEHAQREYETVILDCGNPFGPWNLTAARIADEVVLITTNEITPLQAAQKSIAYFDQQHIDPGKLRIVVNRYERNLGLNQDAIGNALSSEICHIIPADHETVQRSLIEGKPIPPSSAFGKNIAILADRLVGSSDKGDSGGKKGSLGLLSIFNRASS